MRNRKKRSLELYYHQLGRFQEAVIHVEKYTSLIKNILSQIKRELITYRVDPVQLFNEKFYTYKIVFVAISTNKSHKGIVRGNCNRENITIYLDEDMFPQYVEKEDLDVLFKEFSQDLTLLISHELVHRGQYYLRIGDKINFYNFEGAPMVDIDLDYLSNPQECMAYALMYIESLRYSGFTNEEMIAMLKTGNFQKSQSLHIDFYINDIKKINMDTFKRFRKYVYQYLVDPVTYDLKINI